MRYSTIKKSAAKDQMYQNLRIWLKTQFHNNGEEQ